MRHRLAQLEQTGGGTLGDESTGEDSSTSGGSMTGGTMTAGDSMTGGPMTAGDSMTGGPMTAGDSMTGGEESEDACLEGERELPAVPAACNTLGTIADVVACKTAMNVDLTTFLAALIKAGKLPAGSQATCSPSSAQRASCRRENAPDDLRVFITSGNLTLSVTLDGNRIEIGQKGIAGYPGDSMIMADLRFGDPGTTSLNEAYYNAYPPDRPGNACNECHNLDDMYKDPKETITYNSPGGQAHEVKVLVLDPIGLTSGDFVGNTQENLRNPTTLFESACVGSDRASDHCNRLGAVLGHTPVVCAKPAACNGDFVCDRGECNSDCPDDCPDICGNSLCEGEETSQSCAYDCPSS